MPVMNGLDAVKEIRAFYNIMEDNIEKNYTSFYQESDEGIGQIMMPKFVLFSRHTHRVF